MDKSFNQNKIERPEVKIEIFDPKSETWDSVKEAILRVEKEAFKKGFTEDELREDFESDTSIVAILREEDKIIGYAYTIPDDEDPQSACLESIAILPEFQGSGFVAHLTDKIEEKVKSRGYKFMTLDAMTENKYADKIRRHYGDRIVEEGEEKDRHGYGKQKYFKIKL